MDYARLRAWRFPEVEVTYGERDTILYALGIGLGSDPTDACQLGYVTERNLAALPTMAAILADDPPWLEAVGVPVIDAVHGEQRSTFEQALPPRGTVVRQSRIAGVVDKGVGRGVLILVDQELREKHSGQRLCASRQTIFVRGAGGYGGLSGPVAEPHPVPTRAPDLVEDFRTLPQAALIYRLSGDLNPLHSDPPTARAAGFPRPILHGFCTYGIAGWQVLKAYGAGEPTRLGALDVRFSAPVVPGETLRTEMWAEGDHVAFRTRVAERDVVVLTHGRAILRSVQG